MSNWILVLKLKAADLSSATIKRNVDLENRLADLEVELAVWKQAHATALEGAEREAKHLKGRLASLNGQIASMESLMVRLCASPRTTVLISFCSFHRARAY